jgi:hypothetical protein
MPRLSPRIVLWTPGWEAMLVEVLRLLGVGSEDEVLVIVEDARQYLVTRSYGVVYDVGCVAL